MAAEETGAPAGARQPHRTWAPLALFGVFVLLLSAKAYLMRRLVFGPSRAISGSWWELGVIVILLAIAGLLARRGRVWAFLGVDVVLSVVMLATSVYASFYRDIGTASALGVAGEAGGITDSIAQLIRPVHAGFFLDIVIVAVVFAFWGTLRRRTDGPEPRFALMIVAGLLLGVLPIARVLGVTGTSDAMAVARRNGILPYQLASIVRDPQRRGDVRLPSPRARTDSSATGSASSGAMPSASVSPLQAEINRLRGAEGERFVDFVPGSAKRKNLLIIQSEAVQTLLVGARVDGVEVTPELNKLAAESYYFPHTIVTVGKGTTADAEFLANTSVYPPGDRPSSYVYTDYKLPGLPRLLGAAGYDTLTFHADRLSFWHRGQLYPALGWGRAYSRDFFGENDLVGMGPSDEVLFAKTLPELVKTDAAGKPFYAMVITLSAHYPFAPLPASKTAMKLPPVYDGTMLGGYLQRQNYADRALGEFIDGLKSSGLWDDTIVVFYGDHAGLAGLPTAKDAPAYEALLGRKYALTDIMQVPLIVHVPGQLRGKEVTDTAGQIDVLPTVADPLGIDLSQTPHFGRDLWGHGDPFVITRLWMPNGSAATNRGLFLPDESLDNGRWHSLLTGLVTSGLEPAKPITDRVKAIADLSDAYIRSLPKRPK